MNSYLDIQLRKQRHSKAIVNRNNACRQLLLKQQPDVGDIEEIEEIEEGSGENTPLRNRAYWEDDESDGYDPRIRWIQGEHGRYFYDTRSGPQSMYWEEMTPPEGFISDREFNNIVDQFAEITGSNEDEVRRDLQNSESSLAITWREAVNGTYENTNPIHVPGTSMELLDRIIDRSVSLGGTTSEGPGRYEAAGRTLGNAAQTMRRDQVAALAEDGINTTAYVEAIRQGEAIREQREQEESDEPTPRRRTLPYEKVGVSETVFDGLSPWGQASLDSSEVADNNLSLFRTFPDVWLSDAGDAEIPAEHKAADGRVTVIIPESKRGGPLVAKDRRGNPITYPVDMVKRANDIVNAHNRTILEDSIAREGGVVEDLPNSFTALARKDTSIKEAARADGVPEEVVSELKQRAVLYTFEEWIQRRDAIYKRFLKRARNQQKSNKENYGSYTPQRVGDFDEKGIGVIGVPTREWVEEHGSDVIRVYDSFKELIDTPLPVSARVWPPAEEGLSLKDGSEFTNAFQSDREDKTVYQLVNAWFNYNRQRLKQRSPDKYLNEKHGVLGGFASAVVANVSDSIKDGSGTDSTVISIDATGTIGAALQYRDGGRGGTWSANRAGTHPKGFTSWPMDEVAVALETAVNEAGQGLSMGQQLRNPPDDLKDLRKILRGWRDHGGTLVSTSGREQTDRTHAALVFMEFASRFLKEGGRDVETSPLSGYVKDMYKTFGFADGYRASRLNMLWTLTTMGGSYLPREEISIDEYTRSGGELEGAERGWFDEETGHTIDDVMQKSLGTGLNKIAYTEKHDTIKTDNRLDVLQGMLDNLMNKADEIYGFTDKKLAQANEQEIQDLQVYLEMDDEEFEEYLESVMYMFAGTGHPESSE